MRNTTVAVSDDVPPQVLATIPVEAKTHTRTGGQHLN